MKKSILALIFSGAILFTSCKTEATVDSAEVQKIVDAAVAAALQNYPNTQVIADAAAAAATQAVNAGLASLDINGAIEAALSAADALANPTVVRVGTGGVTYISSNTTWTNDKVWLMDGKIVVQNGATLTVEAGTIVKAAAGTGANATVLIVAKGAKIEAIGTAEKPIIFTDANDQIVYANGTTSPNRSVTDKGLWGSVIILGNGIVGAASGEANIEGVVSGYEFTKYGGSNNAENSGTLKYVSIRHTGTAVSPGNELQGLTMGGVGSGTVTENIELIGSEDDGIEIFGGAVNVTNIVIANFDDDGIDLDQNYSGTIENFAVIHGDGIETDEGLEIDGPEGSATGSFTLQNATIIGNTTTENGEYADYRSGATGTTNNIYAYGFKASSDVELDNDGVATNYNDGQLIFGIWELVLPEGVTDVTSLFVNKADNVSVTDFGITASAITEGENTVGANTSSLSWTYSNDAGSLNF